jgi:uncharacterized protein
MRFKFPWQISQQISEKISDKFSSKFSQKLSEKLPWWRSLALLIALCLIASLFLAILERLVQIYSFLAVISPWLAIAVVVILIGGTIAVSIFAAHTLGYFRTAKTKATAPQVSEDKAEAADQNLQALQRQVEQIQDQVAKRSLQEQSANLRQSLESREYKVAIFGTGSAGKTSLANALLKIQIDSQAIAAESQPQGEIAATMGTTLFGEIYSQVNLDGFDAPIQLIDCPGILEAGDEGATREQMARTLAMEADLLLFVVDQDLTQSEFITLKAILDLGKRSLLVFNKIDLFTKSDLAEIKTALQLRMEQFLDPADVVAIAARPAKLRLEDQSVLMPKPKLTSLLERMQQILTEDGKEIVADNILWRSQQLSEAARNLIESQRQSQSEKLIERYQWIVVGVVFSTPLPVVDMLATAAINAQMVMELAKVYGCEISLEQGKELAGSLSKTMASLGIVKGVVRIITGAISVTVVGYLLRSTVQAITAAYLTRIAGYSFVAYFSQNQDWGDGGIAEVVQEQFQLNRRDQFVKLFIKEAMDRVLKT